MTDAAEDLCDTLDVAIEDLRSGIDSLEKKTPEERSKHVGRLSNKIDQAKTELKNLNSEIRELAKSDAVEFVPRAEEFKTILNELSESLNRYKPNQNEVGAEKVKASKREKTAEEDLDEAKKIQGKSSKSVQRSKERTDEIIQIGVATTQQLKDDTVTIERSIEKMQDIEGELAIAKRQLISYTREIGKDRIIRALMILILVGTLVVLGVGIWRRVTSNNSTTPSTAPAGT